MTDFRETTSRRLILAGLVVCLAAVTLTCVYDLDFGFYLAHGRQIVAHGIPKTEFCLPMLGERPWASLWVVGALVLTGSWWVAGPAGLVVLKALGYGGAFGFVAAAGRRRGAPWWLAALVAGAGACALSPRFVERPGLISAFLLGALGWAAAMPSLAERIRRRPWIAGVVVSFVSIVWSWSHAEWIVGLAAFALLLASKPVPLRVKFAYIISVIAFPLASHALLHPSGLRPVLSPFLIPLGGAARFQIAEYTLAAWTAMPLAPVALAIQVPAAMWLWKRRRWAEAALVTGLLVLCVGITRAALPAAILGLPFFAEWLTVVLRARRPLADSLPLPRAALVALLIALMGVATVRFTPFHQFGFGLDPILDARGVGEALQRVDRRAGPVLAEFGWSSLLLSQPSVVRQGVVMDGRQEAYPQPYYDSVYLPLLRPDAEWAGRAEAAGVAFYFEPWSGAGEGREGPRMMGVARAAGWPLVAWDNSGRLAARPDVARTFNMPLFEFDPDALDDAPADPARLARAEAEIRGQCEWLEDHKEALPSARGRIVHARLAARLGLRDSALFSIQSAQRQGGERFARYWVALSEVAAASGDWELAESAADEVEARGSGFEADALRAQIALHRGDREAALRFLRRAADAAPPAEAERLRRVMETLGSNAGGQSAADR